MSLPSPVSAVTILARGTVSTADTNGVFAGSKSRLPAVSYLRGTPATKATDAVLRFAEDAVADAGNALETAHLLSAAVAKAVTYKPGKTDAATTAAEAMEVGEGVCQDHAHLMLAAARALGIPARYVVGYLQGLEEAPEMALATHAWAELMIEGIGWVGFDPANELCPTEDYVRLATGLDAHDAAPIRGSVAGGAEEEALTASVTVAPAGGQSQSQSQSQ